MKVIIEANGTLRHIYSDDLAEMDASLGTATTKRASDVEPAASGDIGWTAHMGRVGGPSLGPFATRAEALANEVDWLERNHLPSVN